MDRGSDQTANETEIFLSDKELRRLIAIQNQIVTGTVGELQMQVAHVKRAVLVLELTLKRLVEELEIDNIESSDRR